MSEITDETYCILEVLDDNIIKDDRIYVVVAYDVVSNKRRHKLAVFLQSYGERVQRSVFECSLTKVKLRKLLKALPSYIDEKEDYLRVYRLKGKSKILTWGKAVYEEEDFYFV